MVEMWSGANSRWIVKRIVVACDLVLLTPAHLGNGDGDDIVDLPLLLDAYDEAAGRRTPLLTGASIAGALRGYLREVEHGYGARLDSQTPSASIRLFGGLKQDDAGEQSPLIVDDARPGAEANDGRPAGVASAGVELRDGVKLDPASRTAADKAKFDLQLWAAGTRFPLRFELSISEGREGREGDDEIALKQALATALAGLENGDIAIGARKQRGYGRVKAERWRLREYDLRQPADLIAWIDNGSEEPPQVVEDLASALGVNPLASQLGLFHLRAEFDLSGSILIRSGGAGLFGPNDEHLRSHRAGALEPQPILSGTSLGGALRARAGKICRTLGATTIKIVDDVWGADMEEVQRRRRQNDLKAKPRASRLIVAEHVIENGVADLVQSRVSIDRFTGGALNTALFNQQPVFGKAGAKVTVELRLLAPQAHEIGLLLLLLKDLWTSDLPLGGESSVGRGRLTGRNAVLSHVSGQTVKSWALQARGKDEVEVTGHEQDELEAYVLALHRWIQEDNA